MTEPSVADSGDREPLHVELAPDRPCDVCTWPLDAFDHAERHKWTLFWLSLAPNAGTEQRQPAVGS